MKIVPVVVNASEKHVVINILYIMISAQTNLT